MDEAFKCLGEVRCLNRKFEAEMETRWRKVMTLLGRLKNTKGGRWMLRVREEFRSILEMYLEEQFCREYTQRLLSKYGYRNSVVEVSLHGWMLPHDCLCANLFPRPSLGIRFRAAVPARILLISNTKSFLSSSFAVHFAAHRETPAFFGEIGV